MPCVLYTTGVSSVLIKGSANLLSFLTTRLFEDARLYIYVIFNPQPKAGVPSTTFSDTLNFSTKAMLGLVVHFFSEVLVQNFHALILTSACRLVVHAQKSWVRPQHSYVSWPSKIVAPSQTGSSVFL